jgi:hypothetical protein
VTRSGSSPSRTRSGDRLGRITADALAAVFPRAAELITLSLLVGLGAGALLRGCPLPRGVPPLRKDERLRLGPHDQDRTGGMTHDFLGDTAEQSALEAAAAVTAYDDEIRRPFSRSPHDLGGRIAGLNEIQSG